MNTNTPEHTSNIKSSNVWNSPFKKQKKLLWNFQSAKTRGKLPEISPIVKNRGKGIYQLGQYVGPLEDLKHFARLKGIELLKMGAISIKTLPKQA